jgi:hypothetical protein
VRLYARRLRVNPVFVVKAKVEISPWRDIEFGRIDMVAMMLGVGLGGRGLWGQSLGQSDARCNTAVVSLTSLLSLKGKLCQWHEQPKY